MSGIEIVKGTPESPVEIVFAVGQTIGTQRIRVTYANLNEMEPEAKFPTIYKTHGDNSITQVSFTPEEGRFLAYVFNRMFPEKGV